MFTHLRRYTFLTVALLTLLVPSVVARAGAEREPEVKVQILGDEIRSSATLFVPAPRQRVWEVLTDFERAPEFTRDLQMSRVVARSGDTVRLQQRSQVRVGPLTVPVETVRDVRLVPPARAEARLVSGSLKRYESTTELVPQGGGTLIVFRSSAVPGPVVAGFADETRIRRETEEHFRQLRTEILRREHVASARQQTAASGAVGVQ